jgi:hypothetical protein
MARRAKDSTGPTLQPCEKCGMWLCSGQPAGADVLIFQHSNTPGSSYNHTPVAASHPILAVRMKLRRSRERNVRMPKSNLSAHLVNRDGSMQCSVCGQKFSPDAKPTLSGAFAEHVYAVHKPKRGK